MPFNYYRTIIDERKCRCYLMAEMSNSDMFKYALDTGIIDIAYVQEQIEMKKHNDILAKHPFDIWQGKNGKWYTYIPDDKKGRIQRERTTREAIENVIVDYWKQFETNPTVKDIFYECYNDKLSKNEISKATYDRYEVDFNRYFHDFKDKHFKDIDEFAINDFMRSIVSKFNLTAKAYSNARTLVYGIFKYALWKKLVSFSITTVVNDIDISQKSFKKVKKSAESQVYTEDELPLILDYLEHNLDMINLGLLLMFKTGVRIGELATLKRDEVVNYTIPINRTETRFKDENGNCMYSIKESPKTEAGEREVVIQTKYKWILDKILEINQNGEYLFEKKGNRVKTYSFRRRLRYICETKIHIQPKSPHKIRKTYCTILIDNNVPDNLIIDQMGHTDIKTSRKHYDFNRRNNEQKRSELDNIAEL